MHRILRKAKELQPIEAFSLFLLFATIVAGVVYFVHLRVAADQQRTTDLGWSLIARPISAKDHTIGSISAPVQVIAYSSLACRYCGQFFEQELPKLESAFGNKIVVAYRHNPIPQLPSAQIQEPASECVYQLGGNNDFWRFANGLFPQAESAEAATIPFLTNLAKQSGVSATAFSACMQADSGEPRVQEDKKEAAIAGLTTDPSFLLKSANRALVVYGNRYSQVYAGIQYLLTENAQQL